MYEMLSKHCIILHRSRVLHEVEAPWISRQSAHESCKVVSPRTGQLYPPRCFISFRAERPQAQSPARNLKSMNLPMTPSEIKRACFRLVAFIFQYVVPHFTTEW